MPEFFLRFFQVTCQPEAFFARIRDDRHWSGAVLHLVALAAWLSAGPVLAWGSGIAGDTPINSSLGAQMDVYPYWRDTLLPRFGSWSYILAASLIMLDIVIITAIWTPIIFLVFRFLGGAHESGGLRKAFQGFVYGLTPCAFGGFVPGLALFVGFYAALLQLHRGPAITLRNQSVAPYLFLSAFMAYAIARYWQHTLLP